MTREFAKLLPRGMDVIIHRTIAGSTYVREGVFMHLDPDGRVVVRLKDEAHGYGLYAPGDVQLNLRNKELQWDDSNDCGQDSLFARDA